MLPALRRSACQAAAALMSTSAKSLGGPMEQSIARKLEAALAPVSLSIRNDSHKHAGHSGNPSGAADAETHFTVEVVSTAFESKSAVQRHRMVYQLLGDEFGEGLHALALKTKTPGEAPAAAAPPS